MGGGIFWPTSFQCGAELAKHAAGKESRLCAPGPARFVRPLPDHQRKGTFTVKSIRSLATALLREKTCSRLRAGGIACLATSLALVSTAQAVPIFAGDGYSVSFVGASVYNGSNGDLSQGLVFDDTLGSAGGAFTTTAAPSASDIHLLPPTEVYRNQVDAPYDSQVFDSNAGTTLFFAIDDDGLLRVRGFGNLSLLGLGLGAVSADVVFTGLDPLFGQTIDSLTLITNTSLFNAVQPSIVDVTAAGFTLRLSDDASFDMPSGEIVYQINVVPEPGTALLLGGGLLGLAAHARRRQA